MRWCVTDFVELGLLSYTKYAFMHAGQEPPELALLLQEQHPDSLTTGECQFAGRIVAFRADSMDSVDRASITAGTSWIEFDLHTPLR